MRVNASAMSCAQGQDGGIFRCRRRWPLAVRPAVCRILRNDDHLGGEGTYLVISIRVGRRRRRRQVRVGAPDRALTANAGLAAVTELCDRLGVVEELDAAVGPINSVALQGKALLVQLDSVGNLGIWLTVVTPGASLAGICESCEVLRSA